MNLLSKQEQRVMDYMTLFGSITSIEAFKDLGITRLAAVIFRIKKKLPGTMIGVEINTGKNRYGELVRFTKYYIDRNEVQL